MSQNGNLPQIITVGVNINHIWNHHLDNQSSKALDDDDLQRDAYGQPWQLVSLMKGKRVAYRSEEEETTKLKLEHILGAWLKVNIMYLKTWYTPWNQHSPCKSMIRKMKCPFRAFFAYVQMGTVSFREDNKKTLHFSCKHLDPVETSRNSTFQKTCKLSIYAFEGSTPTTGASPKHQWED